MDDPPNPETGQYESTSQFPSPPPPRDDLIYPDRVTMKAYLDSYAAAHGFTITTRDTRTTSIYYKCFLGDHRHPTKAKNEAKEGKSPSTNLKTCPFRVTVRNLRRSRRVYLDIENATHNHATQNTIESIPVIIPTQPQAPEPIVHISAPPHQPGYLSNRYQELLDAMQRLSTHTQTCLITRFLRDCEFAKDLETPASINPLSHSLATSSKTLDIPVSTQLQMKNSTTRPLKSPITHLSPLDKFVTPLSPSTFHPVKVASPTPAQSHDPPSHIDEATTNISEAPTTTTAKEPTPSNDEQANADADQALLEAINQTNIEKIMADDEQGVYHNLGVTSKEQEPTSEDLPAFDPYDSNAKNDQPELPKETHTDPRATSDNPIPNPDPAPDLGPVLQQAPAPIKRGRGRKRKNTNTKTNKTSIDPTLIAPHSSTSLSVPKPKKRKMPKGWVAIDEDDDSVNLEPNGDVEPPANPDPTPVPALASKASRGRKGKGKETPQIAPRSSTRLNPVSKEVVSASQSPTPIAANSGATPISEPQESLATTSTSIVLDRKPDIRSTTSTTKTSRRMAKLKCQYVPSPEQMEEDEEIEKEVLKQWPFVETLPRYILPSIKMATNVRQDGLCAFSSVAVSLGRSPDEAQAVRAELARHLHEMTNWYTENIPKFSSDFDFASIASILDSTEPTAEPSEWFPMPMGGYIIANTYNLPVIFYSPSDANSTFIPPCFVSPDPKLRYTSGQTIVLGFINKNHFISLDLIWNDHLPIPFLHPDWKDVRWGEAERWGTFYENKIILFMNLKWQRAWIAQQSSDNSETRRILVDIEEDDDSSRESDKGDNKDGDSD